MCIYLFKCSVRFLRCMCFGNMCELRSVIKMMLRYHCLAFFVSVMCNGICARVVATSVVAAQIPVDMIQSFFVIGHSHLSGILSVSAV